MSEGAQSGKVGRWLAALRRRDWRSWAHHNRAYLLCAAVVAVMAVIAPRFATSRNAATLLKFTSIDAYAAIGFTIVLIAGQLDLSIGSVATLGGMLLIGIRQDYPQLGWTGALLVAVGGGALVGLVNGLLVAKAKINSFIVTLGAMIIVQGLVNVYCKGDTKSVLDTAPGEFLDRDLWWAFEFLWLFPLRIWLSSPRILLVITVTGALAVIFSRTPVGRGVYLIGGNRQTAWHSGLPVGRYLIGVFVACGMLAALGGALTAMETSSANPTTGAKSLMLIIAAVIIGGTSMAGGRGSVVQSVVALLALIALNNGLSYMGQGFDIQRFASAFVLAVAIIYDACALRREAKVRGQRADLLEELKGDPQPGRRREAEK